MRMRVRVCVHVPVCLCACVRASLCAMCGCTRALPQCEWLRSRKVRLTDRLTDCHEFAHFTLIERLSKVRLYCIPHTAGSIPPKHTVPPLVGSRTHG